MAESVSEITTKKAFNAAIAQPGISVVLFGAPWCGACKVLKPNFDKLATESLSANGNAFHFYQINGDKGAGIQIADGLHVDAFPTVYFFRNGASLTSLRGPSIAEIAAKCNAFL